jgi:hypothetical protein
MQIVSLEAITLLLAIYGAVLSTILAIREIRKDERKILVRCNLVLSTIHLDEVRQHIKISAVNVGHRPVELVSTGLYLSNKLVFTPMPGGTMNVPLPKKLNDGDSVDILIDLLKAQKALEEQRAVNHKVIPKFAFVRDAEGNEYKTKISKSLKKMIITA